LRKIQFNEPEKIASYAPVKIHKLFEYKCNVQVIEFTRHEGRTGYNIEKVIEDMHSAHLPDKLGLRLRLGL